MSPKAAARSLYAVHPSVDYVRAVVANLKEKTGRNAAEWLALVERDGPDDDAARREWLRKKHKLGMTTAALIAEISSGKGRDVCDPAAYLRAAPRYVEAMYAGKKAALRPIHDALIELGRSLFPELRICPCETIVPFYRDHVIAQIKPATLTRVDFGLALKGAAELAKGKLPARLVDTGGLKKGDRITHCFRIGAPSEIDAEVKRWLKIAWELDAP